MAITKCSLLRIIVVAEVGDKEEMDKTRIGWDKQSTLFKSLSVSGFSKLEVNMRSLPSEMHQTFQPEPRDPMPVEKEKSSTTDILQQLTSGAPQPTPIPAPSISSSDTNIQEQKQAPPSSAIITPDPPQEIFTKRRGLGS